MLRQIVKYNFKRIKRVSLTLFFCLVTGIAFAANSPPRVGTITPSSGTSNPGQAVIFTTTYIDADGWQNIRYVYLLINTALSKKRCFYGYYNQNTNKLYLRNDNNTAWLGGYAPGSNYVIENSFVKLNCAKTTITGKDGILTVKWKVVFKSAFTGTKNSYLYVRDDTNLYSGWVKKGTWTIINQPPSVGTITPSSGTSNPGEEVKFATTYTDPDGWLNISSVRLLINTSANGKKCFYAYYDQGTNKLYLRNDANTAWLGGYPPGSTKVIENSYTKLDCSKTTVLGKGKNLTVKWVITFKSTFFGKKNLYLYAKDNAGASTGWVKKGTWTITQILSITVNPKEWDIGSTQVNEIVTMGQASKITVTNDGIGPETFELSLINPSIWQASTRPGQEKYVLSGLFCNPNDTPEAANFNQDATADDVITLTPKKATSTTFGYSQATANGVAVPSKAKRSLYLQFKSPTITQKKGEQNISVIVSCQVP